MFQVCNLRESSDLRGIIELSLIEEFTRIFQDVQDFPRANFDKLFSILWKDLGDVPDYELLGTLECEGL